MESTGDLVPKRRNEEADSAMSRVRHHNRYGSRALLFVLALLFATVSVRAQTKIRSLTNVIEGHAVGGVTVDLVGNIYVADFGEYVWKITPEGKVETILKAERPWTPTGVAVRGKDIFVLEYTHTDKPKDWAPRVRKLSADGKVTILADLSLEGNRP